MNRHSCRLRARSGQSVVEFVLIAPILLLLVFGLVEFARAWNIRHVVTDAAREGARNLAIDNPSVTSDSIVKIINRALGASGLQPATLSSTCGTDPCVTLDDGGGIRGASARVGIVYPYELSITRALLGWAVEDGRLTIRTTFTMRNE